MQHFTNKINFARFRPHKKTHKRQIMKFLKATVTPKKSHPDNPPSLTLYSNEHTTAKGFTLEIQKMMREEDPNHKFWFAPSIERITEDSYNEAVKSEIEDEKAEIEEIEPVQSNDEPETLDRFYWFQYTPKNPIVVRVSGDDELTASYRFGNELFLDIDKSFKKEENAVIYALGLVIDDCTASPSQDGNAIIKGIGNRSESAIPDALMSKADIALLFGESAPVESEPETIKPETSEPRPWENNPDIEYQKLYEAIVNVIGRYTGDQMPSALNCYESLMIASLNVTGEFSEMALVREVEKVKNPHNFTNSTSAVNIVMTAHPEKEEKEETAQSRLAEKFKEEVSPASDNLDFELDEKSETESEPEKSEFQKHVDSINEKIKTLEIGELIKIDNLPNEVYHACDGISSSQIKDAMQSMMYFNAKYNTQEIEKPTGAHFDVGNVFHSICLEPDLTSKEFICEPSGDDVPKKPSDAQLKKYNDWVKLGSPEKKENPKAYPTDLMFERCGFWLDWYSANDNLCPVEFDDWKIAESMAKSALNDSDSSKLLKHSMRECETSYFKRCETTGLVIKARPDLEIGRIIGDLKSIALRGQFDEKYLISALRKEVFNRNYHLSAAMYLDITGKDQFLWIFTNKQKGYHWTATIKASSEILEKGFDLYSEYKQKIAESISSGEWKKPESITSSRNPETGKIELPTI